MDRAAVSGMYYWIYPNEDLPLEVVSLDFPLVRRKFKKLTRAKEKSEITKNRCHMNSITKTGEGYYLATLGVSHSVLKKGDCAHLKYALSGIIKAHREISIDIKGIRSIELEAYRLLEEMKRNADHVKCRIRFINVDPMVSPAIRKLQEKKILFQDEFEQA
jgi:hypothetical protein